MRRLVLEEHTHYALSRFVRKDPVRGRIRDGKLHIEYPPIAGFDLHRFAMVAPPIEASDH
jgi:hypothetical protein